VVGLACFAALASCCSASRAASAADLRISRRHRHPRRPDVDDRIIQKALWSGKVYGFWEPINKGAVASGRSSTATTSRLDAARVAVAWATSPRSWRRAW